jgi:hypothetical protein
MTEAGGTSNPAVCQYTKLYESWGIRGHFKMDYEDEEAHLARLEDPDIAPRPWPLLSPGSSWWGANQSACNRDTQLIPLQPRPSLFIHRLLTFCVVLIFVSAFSFPSLQCRVTLSVLLHYFSFASLSYHAMFSFFVLLLLVVFFHSSLSLYIIFLISVLFVYIALFFSLLSFDAARTVQKTAPATILHCRGNAFTELLPSNDRYTDTHRHTRPTILLLLRVYSLPREREYRPVA